MSSSRSSWVAHFMASATWYHSVAMRWKVSSSSCGGCVSDVEGASRAVGGSGTLLLTGVAALRCTAVLWFFSTARAASKKLATYSSFCAAVNDSQSASTMASKLVRPAVTSVLVGRNGPMGRVSPQFCGRRQRSSTPRDPQPSFSRHVISMSLMALLTAAPCSVTEGKCVRRKLSTALLRVSRSVLPAGNVVVKEASQRRLEPSAARYAWPSSKSSAWLSSQSAKCCIPTIILLDRETDASHNCKAIAAVARPDE